MMGKWTTITSFDVGTERHTAEYVEQLEAECEKWYRRFEIVYDMLDTTQRRQYDGPKGE